MIAFGYESSLLLSVGYALRLGIHTTHGYEFSLPLPDEGVAGILVHKR